MNSKFKFLFAATAVSLALSVAAIGQLFDDRGFMSIDARNGNGECVHDGYHYGAKPNSFIKNGNKEFWTCCSCHEMFLSNPGGTFSNKSQYDYSLEGTKAYVPSDGRSLGNVTNATLFSSTLDDYAFKGVYGYSGYAQAIIKENINISRYQKVAFAFKSESLWFVLQDPSWATPFAPEKWYHIELEQTSKDNWNISYGELGSSLSSYKSVVGNDLRAIVGLGSDVGTFYITDFLAAYEPGVISGTKIDECVYSANGIQMHETYEAVPTGFEKVMVTETKTEPDSFFHGQFFSALDLSDYSKVRFAMKANGYFLLNHSWSSNIDGNRDWLIFELTNKGSCIWDLTITNYNGVTVYRENGLSGAISGSGVYSNNSLNAILYGNCSGFTPAKNNAYDLYVCCTEVRGFKNIPLDNNYKIIYDASDRNAWQACQDLFDRIGRVTGWSVYLPPEEAGSQTYSENSKIISVGNTAFASSCGVNPSTDLGTSGFAVKTVGKSVVIKGDDSLGNTTGVRYFMEQTIDYDFFAHTDTDTVETYAYTPNVLIPELNVEYGPSIGFRQITTSQSTLKGAHKIGLGYTYDNNGAGFISSEIHTLSDMFLPYDSFKLSHYRWYSKSGSDIQLCYSARGNASEYMAMKNELFNELTPLIASFDEKTCYVNLTIRDNWHQCDCSTCKAEMKTYGGYAGQIMHFVSEVADMVDAWVAENNIGKTVKYVFLAYQQAQDAPTSVPYGLNHNIIAYYAPPKADFSKDFSETENSEYYHQLVGWANLLKSQNMKDSLWFWAYDNQTQCYMLPFNDYESFGRLISTLNRIGVSSVHVEMPYVTRTPCFEDLNVYVKGKLLNDCTLNFDDLVNKFMTNYYGPAASNMKMYYNKVKSIMQANVSGTIFSNANNKDYWSVSDVTSMLATLDGCLNDVSMMGDDELRASIEGRIHRERITPIFLLMEHYVNSHTFDKATMINLLTEFKTYTNKYGISMYNYNTSLSGRIASYEAAVNALQN